MNTLTHWLDASNVYGSTEKELDSVRVSNTSARLKVTSRTSGKQRRGRALLPTCGAVQREERHEEINACGAPCDKAHCQVAGDQRVNAQPGLASMHTIWLREHNRLAELLHTLNSHWDPERVFQEARRVLIAEWQHVIYNEWLPLVLGPYMETLDLSPLARGYTKSYSEETDPRIHNEFATAAFRFVNCL